MDNSNFALYGNKTLRVLLLDNEQVFLRTNYENIANIQGHKIYSKVFALTESSTVNQFFYLEFTEKNNYWYGDDNPYEQYISSVSFSYKKIDTYKWVYLSNYANEAKYNYLKIMLAQGNTNNTSGSIFHFDGLLVIDLTATFGKGNEPDKEWCDNHINYFDGTTTIYK